MAASQALARTAAGADPEIGRAAVCRYGSEIDHDSRPGEGGGYLRGNPVPAFWRQAEAVRNRGGAKYPATFGRAGRPVLFDSGPSAPRVYRSHGRSNDTDRKSTRLNSSHRCISYAV